MRHLALWILLTLSLDTAAQMAPSDGEVEQLYRNVLSTITQGDLQSAQQQLLRLMQLHPNHAGAWLDAAMLWCQLGQSEKALATWAEIEARFDPPIGILQFIQTQRQRGCMAPSVAQKPVWRLELSRGHTSNVNQGPRSLQIQLPSADGPVWVQLSADASPRGDGYSQLEHSVEEVPLIGGWKAHAQWQWRRHDTASAMDMQALAAGLGRHWQGGQWQGRLRATLGGAWLGNQLYQRSAQLHAEAAPPWQPLAPWRWQLSTTLQQLQYPTLTHFDALRWELSSHWSRDAGNSRWLASLGLLHDQGHAERPGGNRHGWQAGVHWNAVLGQWQQQPVMAHIQWQWQDWSGSRSYAPGLIDVTRQQRTHTASAALQWSPDRHNAWVLELRHVRNNENIGLFTYSMTQLQLGWRHQWGRVIQ